MKTKQGGEEMIDRLYHEVVEIKQLTVTRNTATTTATTKLHSHAQQAMAE